MAVDSSAPKCRFCRSDLRFILVDLGMSPLCESYLTTEQLGEMERFYPLTPYVCEQCFLVQLQEYVPPKDIFSEYAYYSSYSDSWLGHMKTYADMVVERFGIGTNSRVVEIASNDGYLLQYFVEKGMSVLGVEPAGNVARCAVEKGIPTKVDFFGAKVARDLAATGGQADLLIGNNVLAQVPDLNDFVAGLKILLKPSGVLTMEFPHLLRLVEDNQFDTICHEHFSYFSFLTVEQVFAVHGLVLFDVETLPTHGGSLRIYARHNDDVGKPVSGRVCDLRATETAAGLTQTAFYESFAKRVQDAKHKLLGQLIRIKEAGKSIVGYGAPGKGNTLLNYCGIRTDFLDYTVDRNPFKCGKYTPGTHLPIYPVERIRDTRPDYLLILPWNLKDEILQQMNYIREWGGGFVLPIPEVTIVR